MGFCLLIAFFCIFVLSPSFSLAAYDQTDASRFLDYAGAAYCCGGLGSGCLTWECPSCKKHPGLQNITELYADGTNANGFVGVNPTGEGGYGPFIIVSFSGTNPLSIKNWIDDINTLKVSYPPCSGCFVHEGFYDTYLSVQSQMVPALQALIKEYPSLPIQVTGHSLGGALSIHAALDIIHTFNHPVDVVYNFGQPRVGNPAFETYQKIVLPTYRVTHWEDPVPHLPPEILGFVHGPTEIFYNSNNTAFKVCDSSGEDPTCSDQFPVDANVNDHLYYINFDFVSNFLSCML
jgi:hypothetical protein